MKNRILWIDYLRSFIILLVVAHHSALAYNTFAHFNKAAYIFSSHPIVDVQRWIGLDFFVYFNDIFFMSLLFFVSGLFVMTSLQKKGSRAFLHDRFNRLFIPFIFAVTVLMLIAHYPAYYVAHGQTNILAYGIDFFTTEYWPVGPPWFIWVLFLFNLILVLIFPVVREWFNKFSGQLVVFKNKPLLFFITLFLFTWIIYVPMRLLFGPAGWTGLGPFDFQKSRLLLYSGYFLFGALFGIISLEKGVFSNESAVVKKWPVWVVLCLLTFLILLVSDSPLKQIVEAKIMGETSADLIYSSIFAASCTLSCIAFLTAFKSLINTTYKWWDSLTSNSFAIYIIHYVFIIWAQFILLRLDLPAILKFIMVFLIALSASWSVSYLLRKNNLIRKYL